MNFVDWFRNQLLPNLTQPSLIILDNASYHKSRVGYSKPVGRMRKQEVFERLPTVGVQFEENITAVEAKFVLRSWFNEFAKLEIVDLADKFNHRVLFTPPCYSDLQPIVLLWAYIKGRIGRAYSTTTKLSDVKRQLDLEFDSLHSRNGQELINRIIMPVNERIEHFKNQIEEDEVLDSVNSTANSINSTCSDSPPHLSSNSDFENN